MRLKMSREDFFSVLRVFCIFAGKYERISEKIDVFSWTSSMYKVVSCWRKRAHRDEAQVWLLSS